MSFITRRAIGRRLGSVNSINSGFQPRTSAAYLLPRFVTNAAATSEGPAANSKPEKILSTGLKDSPELIVDEGLGPDKKIDWSKSFHGLSVEPFSKETADVLLAPLDPEDVEVKPDGIIYLPEIKYRRILNKAFGPGAWGLAPRGETIVTDKAVTREYALVCNGRLVSVARGEQDYFDPSGIPTATEGCKSNALMRCCKDLGIASELWDPRWIRGFRKKYCDEKFGEHQLTKKKKKLWVKKGDTLEYPYKVVGF
ncbi:uncharacterized protein LAJ45_02092 [Morchella importuna]|uniref:uncharacterized protein n=1 Tax=Morchella importuna TaxID=1174673 RepID=UPI001E8CA276|nr:uncharacterized protein LAJ45_02092 [Morchella importuna]KAH8154324.1 hypothetical protein LAJ45_02092 [Morchella importuna]